MRRAHIRRTFAAVVLVAAAVLVWEVGSIRPGLGVAADEKAAATAKGSPNDVERAYRELAGQVAELERIGKAFEAVARVVGPSVVHIRVEKSLAGRGRAFPGSIEESGSGVIAQFEGRPDYFVLTNHHVVSGADRSAIMIHLADGRVLRPERIWSDQPTDVALLKIAAPDLRPARLGDSDKVQIGNFVLANGSPFGLAHTVTHGIISAKGRRDLALGLRAERASLINQDFLQTDAAINPGNSGGPLLNLRGEVIGINTAIASASGGNEGVGFSIPINLVKRVAPQLLREGSVSRAMLGINLNQGFGLVLATELGLDRPRGAMIQEVYPDTPAAAAGLKPRDVVLEFDGTTVEDDSHLINLVSLTPVGKEVSLVVWRDKGRQILKTRLGDRHILDEIAQRIQPPGDPAAAIGGAIAVEALGIEVVELTSELTTRLGVPSAKGLLIMRIDPMGPGRGELRHMDVIDQIEGKPVATVAELQAELAHAKPDEGIVLRVRRLGSDRLGSRRVVVQP